jgi:hypothetical protein
MKGRFHFRDLDIDGKDNIKMVFNKTTREGSE